MKCKCPREILEEETEIKQKIDGVRFWQANGESVEEGSVLFCIRIHIGCGGEVESTP